MKFCVIGTGRFGYSVATTLVDNGMEVLAVDKNESIIASIRDKVTQAVCIHVTDEDSLRAIGVEDMDTVIVALGENFAESILVTAILKHRLNIKQVITRSISGIHRDILQLIGADQVVLPEQQVGRQLANNLSLPFKALARLSATFCVSELEAPDSFIGHTLSELALYDTYAVQCIGIKFKDDIMLAYDQYTISPGDLLIIAGAIRDIARVSKL